MSAAFIVRVSDDQERDLLERAAAVGCTMAELLARVIADKLFAEPVEVDNAERQGRGGAAYHERSCSQEDQ